MSEIIDAITAATSTTAQAKPVLTKEEKLARIQEQITKLQAKYDDILNDRVQVKVKKEIALPAIGETVEFLFGRKTATTNPVRKSGVVIAIKPAVALEGGKTSPAQIKVQTGEGFDAEFNVLYPAQIIRAEGAGE